MDHERVNTACSKNIASWRRRRVRSLTEMLACLTAEKGLRALVAVVFIKKNIVTENTEEEEKKDAIS